MKKWGGGAFEFESLREDSSAGDSPRPASSSKPSTRTLQQHQRDARQLSRVLSFLEKWRLKRLDLSLCRALIRLCANSRALPEALLLHSHIQAQNSTQNSTPNPMLANELIRMFGLCSSVDQAVAVFNSIPKPDLYSHNCLLAAYTHNGHLHSALELFERMPEKSSASWNTMLTAFLNHGFFLDAKDLFNEMPDRNTVSWNIMLTAYAQNGQVSQALELIQHIPSSDSCVTWNILITGFSRETDGQQSVIHLLRKMILEGVSPSARTFGPVLFCLTDVHLCRQCHRIVYESGFYRNLHTMNSLLGAYVRLKSFNDCVTTFSSMGVKDNLTYRLMITAFSESGDLQSAVRVFDSLSSYDDRSLSAMSVAYATFGYLLQARSLFEEVVEKPAKAYVELIRAYGKAGDVVGAEVLFYSIPQKNELSWNSMAAAYVESGQLHQCGKFLLAMDLEGIRASDSFLAILFNSCSLSSEAFLLGKTLLLELELELVDQPGEVQAAVFAMYSKHGSFLEVFAVFSEMSMRDASVWTSMIRLSVQEGFLEEALMMLPWMSLEGVLPESSTFAALLHACETPDECGELIASMVGSYGVEPGFDHYVCMLESLCSAGRVSEAEELVNSF